MKNWPMIFSYLLLGQRDRSYFYGSKLGSFIYLLTIFFHPKITSSKTHKSNFILLIMLSMFFFSWSFLEVFITLPFYLNNHLWGYVLWGALGTPSSYSHTQNISTHTVLHSLITMSQGIFNYSHNFFRISIEPLYCCDSLFTLLLS